MKTTIYPLGEVREELNHNTVIYGQIVEVRNEKMGWESGYHAGMKVHFFNKKGVLVGNLYEFLPWDRVRNREDAGRKFPRYFMDKSFENTRMFLYVLALKAISPAIRLTQKINA